MNTEIPNFWKMLANDPNELERSWNSLKQVMRKIALDGYTTKELIYLQDTITNRCEYCTRSHSYAAKKSKSDEMIKEMISVVGLAFKNNHKLVDDSKKVDNDL